jgi:predicted XRE-type DNA-binding protein
MCCTLLKEIEVRNRHAEKGRRFDSAKAGRRRVRQQRKAELNMTKANKPRTTKPAPEITYGSGNVFAGLGLRNPERELMKARLTLQICRMIQERGLTQAEAAQILGIKQPHVSPLMRNRAGSFSIGPLMEFVTDLGQDIELKVRPTRCDHGEMSVTLG